MSVITNAEHENLTFMLARCGIYVEETLPEQTTWTIYACLRVLGDPMERFPDLHFGYQAVPEVYLTPASFDRFFPSRRYLSQLHDELEDDINIEFFVEALGCHLVPDSRLRQNISSVVSSKLLEPTSGSRHGIVLVCWDRIEKAADHLELNVFDLSKVVRIHEHSHAARESRLGKTGDPDLLNREETVAQEETYMFLRSQGQTTTINAMERLMAEQPNCYHIRIP